MGERDPGPVRVPGRGRPGDLSLSSQMVDFSLLVADASGITSRIRRVRSARVALRRVAPVHVGPLVPDRPTSNQFGIKHLALALLTQAFAQPLGVALLQLAAGALKVDEQLELVIAVAGRERPHGLRQRPEQLPRRLARLRL